MDLLTNLAIPQSVEHFHVLILIGGLISIVLYPYLGFLLGSSVLSYFYNRKGTRERNRQLTRFSNDLIVIVLYNKSVPTILALVPSFTSIFIYAQLLQSTEAISVGLAGYGFILLLIAIVSLYAYKYTFRLRGVLHEYEGLLESRKHGAVGLEEIHDYSEETIKSHLASGRAGIIFLVAASFLIVSSMAVTANPSNWNDVSTVFALFISPDVLIRVLQFAALAAGATGVGLLYFFLAWQGGRAGLDSDQRLFVRRLATRLIVGSLLSLPVFVVLGIVALPASSLSGSLYGFAAVALVLIFLTAQSVYAYNRNSQARYVNSAVYTLALASVFMSLNDQVAIHNATNVQAAYLAYRYDVATEELKSRLGVAAPSLSGEDIYNGRCSACHLFDQKKIGPAYRDVLPKYAGKKDQIVAFVLNPIKKDPAFPPMPNQGLKPAEADSIVSYLLRRLGSVDSKATAPGQPVPLK